MLFFGFRPLNTESEDAIGLINNSDKPLNVKYRISPSLASTIFKVFLIKKNNLKFLNNDSFLYFLQAKFKRNN